MGRLIDADALVTWLKSCVPPNGKVTMDVLVAAIDSRPTVDTAPVVHGHWKEHDGKTWCTECGCSNKAYKPPYCPHCGAKMDGEIAERGC